MKDSVRPSNADIYLSSPVSGGDFFVVCHGSWGREGGNRIAKARDDGKPRVLKTGDGDKSRVVKTGGDGKSQVVTEGDGGPPEC